MGIIKAIGSHHRIMCDTAPVIYFIEDHPLYGHMAEELFRLISENSEVHMFSSVITLTEVLTQPLRKSRFDIAEKYREFLINSGNFTLYPIDALIAEKTAEIRSKYSIKTPDAIQIAVAVENNASLFITNDIGLKKIEEIEVLILLDYL